MAVFDPRGARRATDPFAPASTSRVIRCGSASRGAPCRRRIPLALCVLLAACREAPSTGSGRSSAVVASATSSPSGERAIASAPPGRAEPPFEGTAGIIEKGPSDRGIALLTDVRAARHPGFDRVVLEFSGSGLPGYHVEYVDSPVRRCGSGETTPIRGDGWLEVRMAPAAAHDAAGQATIAERERLLDLPVVRELELTCDFEEVVTWVLGAASPNRYRVLELTDPPRLAVDVRHGR
jgi:hypothetical protein